MAEKHSKLIEIQDFTWGYKHSPSFIFDKFNFILNKRDFCFIMGKSGIGKTTLVKFMTRQLKPPKKMIFSKKEDISRFSEKEIQKYRRKIGVIYQDFKLINWKTVKENILFPLEIIGVKGSIANIKLEEVLYKMQLLDKKDVMIPLLSGGEKQRVAMARALISNPEFLIADEPTGNLDWETSKNIANILIDINLSGKTILFITHDNQLVDYVKSKHKIKLINL